MGGLRSGCWSRPDGRAIPWTHARQGLQLRRRVSASRTGDIVTEETAYAPTSLSPEQASPGALLRLWQAHWSLEHRLHRVRDVVFGEDRAITRTGHAHQALIACRNLALSLLYLWHAGGITASRQSYASHPTTLFRRLGLPPSRL